MRIDKMIYFLIPVFNEESNIEILAPSLKTCLPEENKYFVFVDDYSSDNTVNVINEFFSHTNFKVITKEKNFGPGHSFNIGFEWIIENSTSDNDIIVTLEGDNTSDLSILKNMVEISKLGFDLVLSSVYAQGGGFDQTSFWRKTTSLVANAFMRFFFDIKVLTLSSFYRVYKISLLNRIKLKYDFIIEEPGFISMIEILVKSINIKASIIEFPMVLSSKKRIGKSKMKVLKTAISYFKFLIKIKSKGHLEKV